MHRSPALSPRDAEACALVVQAGIDGVERLEDAGDDVLPAVEKCVGAARVDAGERRLVEGGRLHHAVGRKLVDDRFDEADLLRAAFQTSCRDLAGCIVQILPIKVT